MKYKYHCKNCDKYEKIDVEIKNRNNVMCGKCRNKLTRIREAPMSSVQLGCIMSSRKNGVGCFVDFDGSVHKPKTRGYKKDRLKGLYQKK
jgi:hypothetical protein